MLFVSPQRKIAQKKTVAGLQSYLGKHGQYARGDKEAKKLIKITSALGHTSSSLFLVKTRSNSGKGTGESQPVFAITFWLLTFPAYTQKKDQLDVP